MDMLIPNPVISTVAAELSQHYSHSEIDNLLFKADIAVAQNYTNKLSKIQNSFDQLNKSDDDRKINKLYIFIEDFLREDNADNEILLLAQKKILSQLKRYNLIQEKETNLTDEEQAFIELDFSELNIDTLKVDSDYSEILSRRIKEINICIQNEAYLSAIFMIGSILEGMLLAIAQKYPDQFNKASSAPIYNNQVKEFSKWKLIDLINVSYELGYIREDVKKFSQGVRDFRNYIHPHEQVKSKFYPDIHTAKICLQVLKATLADLLAKELLYV